MDRLNEILQERAARLSVTAGCFNVRTAGQDYSLTHDRCFIDSAKLFQDLLAVMNKYDYRATPEELRILKECGADMRKLPKTELSVGAVSGFLLGCMVKQRTGATLLGMYFGYKAQNPVPSCEQCLHRVMCLPTPLGAELEAILRRRAANHPLLKLRPDRSELQGRIATPEYEKQMQSTASQPTPAQTVTAGNELWMLSDPFELCFQQSSNVSISGAVKNAAKSSKTQERKQPRQEMYKARQQARKQQKEGKLSDNP